MKGYIIYNAESGEVKHHGVQPRLPDAGPGQKVIAVEPSIATAFSPMKEYFVADGVVKFPPDLDASAVTAHIATDLTIVERDARMRPMPASAESGLEAAIRECTTEVRALSARLDKMFQL